MFHQPSLAAYTEVLTGNNGLFVRWFLNSTVIALVTTVIGVLVAATGGYAFSRWRFPGCRRAARRARRAWSEPPGRMLTSSSLRRNRTGGSHDDRPR